MLLLVSDLLDYNQIIANKIKISATKFNLKMLIE